MRMVISEVFGIFIFDSKYFREFSKIHDMYGTLVGTTVWTIRRQRKIALCPRFVTLREHPSRDLN